MMNQVRIDRYGLQDIERENSLPLHEYTLWLQVSEVFDEGIEGLVDLSAYGHEGGYRLVQGTGLLVELSGGAAPGAVWAAGTFREGVVEVSAALYESEVAYREGQVAYMAVVASGNADQRAAPTRAVAKPTKKKSRRGGRGTKS